MICGSSPFSLKFNTWYQVNIITKMKDVKDIKYEMKNWNLTLKSYEVPRFNIDKITDMECLLAIAYAVRVILQAALLLFEKLNIP